MNQNAACRLIVAALALSVVACAPLQQAPLVYSSKISLGVDLSGTASEQPGVSLNVGYKQIDAAYVPVAVAKPCEAGDGQPGSRLTDCTNGVFGLMKVQGDNQVGQSKQSSSTAQARNRIEEFKRLNETRKQAAFNLDKARSSQEEARQALNTLEQEKASALRLAEAAKEERTQSDKLLLADQEMRAQKFAMAGKKVEEAESEKKRAEDELAKANLPDLADALTGTDENKKSDAYSVFGSFDASTKASAEVAPKIGTDSKPQPNAKGDASLGIGKVFSTGVAAQNLTEGIRRYYAGTGARACLDTGERFVGHFKQSLNASEPTYLQQLKSLMDAVIKSCGANGDDAQK